MANGDNFAIGGIKDLNLATFGMEGAGNSSAPVTLPNNASYNPTRTNKTDFNNPGFLALTAQHTTANFNSQNFDITFGTTSGLNPYQKLTSDQGKLLHTIG